MVLQIRLIVLKRLNISTLKGVLDYPLISLINDKAKFGQIVKQLIGMVLYITNRYLKKKEKHQSKGRKNTQHPSSIFLTLYYLYVGDYGVVVLVIIIHVCPL